MDPPEEPPRKPGTFQKGFDPRRSSPEQRRGGLHNKIPQRIKRGIFDGAVKHGFDGEGKDGFNGYCRFLAARHPKIYADLLGKLLPTKVTVDDVSAGSNSVVTVNIRGVPSGKFFSAEECKEIEMRGLPPPIETEFDELEHNSDESDPEPEPPAAA